MEATYFPNEHTPLLRNDFASNEHRPLLRICATSIERTSLHLDGPTSNAQASVDLDGATSNAQASVDLDVSTSNGQTSNLGHCGTLKTDEHRPLFRISATTIERVSLGLDDANSNGQISVDLDGPITIQASLGQGTSNSDNLLIASQEPITNEVSLEEVAKALCSAWQRATGATETLAFFEDITLLQHMSTKVYYEMHLAWKSVTRGRRCLHPAHKVAEAAVAAMMEVMHPGWEEDEEEERGRLCYYHIGCGIEKSFLLENLLKEWELIVGAKRFPSRYSELHQDSDEQAQAVSERSLRLVERYDKVRDCLCNTKLHLLLHSLSIIWPISLLVIGSKYVECTMNHHLSYLLIILGILGCSAVLSRMVIIKLRTQPIEFDNNFLWDRLRQKLIEFTFLIVFIVQAFHFFSTDPTTDADPDHCVNFYNSALVVNCISIAFLSVYIFAYLIIICENYLNLWPVIFRYL